MSAPTEIDLTGTHPCPVPGCRLSAEEHHRVNVGLVMENAELRKQQREQPDPLAARKAALLLHIDAFFGGQ